MTASNAHSGLSLYLVTAAYFALTGQFHVRLSSNQENNFVVPDVDLPRSFARTDVRKRLEKQPAMVAVLPLIDAATQRCFDTQERLLVGYFSFEGRSPLGGLSRAT
jgi:hypothetical protein